MSGDMDPTARAATSLVRDLLEEPEAGPPDAVLRLMRASRDVQIYAVSSLAVRLKLALEDLKRCQQDLLEARRDAK